MQRKLSSLPTRPIPFPISRPQALRSERSLCRRRFRNGRALNLSAGQPFRAGRLLFCRVNRSRFMRIRHFVWKSSYKISLSPITFRNNSFESHPNVPDGDFIAEVTLTNIAWNCRCILLTATHGKGGQMADLCTVLRRGSRLRSAAFDNTDGNISCIKIFVLRDLQTALSMCPATVRYS